MPLTQLTVLVARTLSAKAAGDMSGAYQLAYDAFRKSAVSLREAQGLRATSKGGHIAVQEAVTAQFGTAVRTFRHRGKLSRRDDPGPGTAHPLVAARQLGDVVGEVWYRSLPAVT